MPARDGTGPMGLGAASGRALGDCIRAVERSGRAVFGRGFYCRRAYAYTDLGKDSLIREKQALEARLDAINKQLNK